MQKIEVLMTTQNHGAVIDSFFIDKIVEVSTKELSDVINNLYGDFDFISAHQDCMYVDDKGNNHAILLKTKNCIDGFVIMDEDPERQIGYIQDAAHLQVMEVYPSLHLHQREMVSLVDLAVQRSLAGQTEGSYYFKLYDYASQCRGGNFNDGLFAEMLLDRPEIAGVDFDIEDGMVYIDISEEFRTVENNDNLREITKDEFDVICAKHTLWFHEAGGEQADFSNCVIRGMDLSRRNLNQAIFDGAKISNTQLYSAELCYASCIGTKFYNCYATDLTAEEASFKGAEFIGTELGRSVFTHSNFTDARFRNCEVYSCSLDGSCIEGTDFGDTDTSLVRMNRCTYDEDIWNAEQNCSPITM